MLSSISIATSCLTDTWLFDVGATTAKVVLGNPHDTNCWAVNRVPTTEISPAICPYGYTSACDITDGSPHDASETVWACCPSQFACDAGTWSCLKNRGLTMTYTFNTTDILGHTTTTQIFKAGGINAHSIRVAFHSSDILDQFATTAESLNSISTTDSSGSTSTSSPPTPTSSVSPSVSNPETLPSGAWIGIGIAITVGAVIVVSSIFFLVRRRHRNKQQQLAGLQEAVSFPPEPKPTPATEIFSIERPSELNGVRGRYELDANALSDNTSVNNYAASGLNSDASTISTVVAFVRRDLPADLISHPKLKCVLIKDFSQWPEDILQAHADAAGMIWAMGSYKGSRAVDLDYPLAFMAAMERGLAEAKAAEFAESHDDTWRTFVVRPGGVATEKMTGSRTVAAILGENWCVRIEELGAFMTYLTVDGEGESTVIENARIARKGRELLELQRSSLR
ncbi:hypothetical protein O1611_g2064 [Lasiodiplodia mahajangana]|uniref:Uncharacterized protein n=1 Tax=Lasiodiplodia mahajangana TaxID=1108764 RepID=A0ACC2JVR8_9PEZI|nr:hypothetical protein O1611_g2064 [Lasiodiplodia mahajangana]